ncbi:manganese ABC transporter substrate-binding lipoprotein precursor [Clostridium acetireducens DSM 10703]|uniref:Manganese ABC transporter substrate-binding lipoprotein n=1 Tax=Clostridium acetireducens DSM 10703 TaxID=1121290 RepID=A0A1E8F1E2_9CLOT|nr:zinc ABC transporter substrate-binding protein [Clostridium acetireducens]OFI07428.1 manganese ABC transporter substrate-binding lipoprotein precursor [Clostridium acetireducens DSM 10703]
MKKVLGIVVIFIFIFIITIFSIRISYINKNHKINNTKVENKNSVNLNIVATDKLLYYMIKDIVGSKHNVEYMFGNRQDEINFKFSEDSLDNISKQNLFIYFGANFEPWINNFIDNLKKNKVGVINTSRGSKIISYSSTIKSGEYVLKNNPYYWMDLDNCKIILLNIKNAVQDKDPRNREYYEKNFNDIIKTIEKYDSSLKKLSDLSKDCCFIISSEDYDYFFQYSNINLIKINNKENIKYVEENFDKYRNFIFVYTNKDELKENDEIIKKYNMQPLNLIVYREEFKYEDILNYNVKNIENIIQN